METKNRANEHALGLYDAALEKIFTALPIASYHGGETILAAGSNSARLMILKSGTVAILKDSIEIARVREPGSVLGELAALLERPHTAEVRALEDSQFYVADAALLQEEPLAVLHVARILAERLVAADERIVELKRQLQSNQSPSTIRKLVEKVEAALVAASENAPQLTPRAGVRDRF